MGKHYLPPPPPLPLYSPLLPIINNRSLTGLGQVNIYSGTIQLGSQVARTTLIPFGRPQLLEGQHTHNIIPKGTTNYYFPYHSAIFLLLRLLLIYASSSRKSMIVMLYNSNNATLLTCHVVSIFVSFNIKSMYN